MNRIPIIGGLTGSSSNKKVLLLGAGFVAKPCLVELCVAGVQCTVACRTLKSAQEFCKGVKGASAISLDVNNQEDLRREVAKVDLVISLIPYTYHVKVIEAAIAEKKHVVTTSYVSPGIQALDAQAKEAGVVILNEIGLDPGIDHLYAVKTINEVQKAGGKITSFLSYCGGLPAPECSDNPFGYRFSWSARGALLALRNAARFWKDGKIVDIAPQDLMGSAKPYPTEYIGFNFVAYANRDSSIYKERYHLNDAHTIIRGTLRYDGFPQIIRTLADIGYFDDAEKPFLQASHQNPPISYAEATAKILGSSSHSEDDLTWAISSKTRFDTTADKNKILAGLRWLGLFSNDPITPRGTPIDTLCASLEPRAQYEEGQRDMVYLQHKFEIEDKDGSKRTLHSTLIDYADPKGYSAMAKLVGVPCAVGVLSVFDGKIAVGVQAPVEEEVAAPLRETLKTKYGIEMVEKEVSGLA